MNWPEGDLPSQRRSSYSSGAKFLGVLDMLPLGESYVADVRRAVELVCVLDEHGTACQALSHEGVPMQRLEVCALFNACFMRSGTS